MPLVSVIVPVFNTVEYIEACLESVIGQSLQDIEIICVDDGSTDGSSEVLRRYAQEDDRVAVLTQANLGLSAARNAAIESATGLYLCFLDSDDFLADEALEHLVDIAGEARLDILYFSAAPFCDEGSGPALAQVYDRYRTYYQRNRNYPRITSGRELMAEMIENDDYKPSVCLQLFRTAFIWSSGITFREGIYHEDNLYSLQCALAADRVGYTPQPHYHRRIREDSIMTSAKSAAHFNGYYVTYLEMLALVMEQDLDSRTAAAAGSIMSSMFQAASRSLAELPMEDRGMVSAEDDPAVAWATLDILKRQVGQQEKTARLAGKLKKAEKRAQSAQRELTRIKGSAAYRLAKAAQKVLRFGR